jgi:ABC-type amino acid transport substrate-binding protein
MPNYVKTILYSLLILVTFNAYSSNLQSDTIYFKGNYDYPPYHFLDKDMNQQGFTIDIIQAISRTMGITIQLELDEWSNVRSALINNSTDGVAGMSSSAERAEYANFTAPYIYITHAIFVRKESDIKGVDDLKDKRVLVVKGDIMHDYLISNEITKYIVPVKNYKTALRLLSAGEYDCALINKLHGQYAINEFNLSNLIPVGGSIQPKDVCFAISKGREDILVQINDGLKIIKTTGEYDEIYDKWFGVYEKKDIKTQVLNIIVWILFPFLIILFAILIWSWSLRKQVSNKTAELQNELNVRKLAEKKLLHEKSLLNSMINSIPDLIFYKDKNNVYLGCNEAFMKFNDFKFKSLAGKLILKYFLRRKRNYIMIQMQE